MSEYETFKKNRDNKTIDYAHVDSVNIFTFLDDILNKGKNNPLFQFEQPQEIENWLKEQWSGYFRSLLEKKSQNQQLNSLSKQVRELSSINNSLQRYLEEVIKRVGGDSAETIIETEHINISNDKLNMQLMECSLFSSLVNIHGISNEDAKDTYLTCDTLKDLVLKICELTLSRENQIEQEAVINYWKGNQEILDKLNAIRDLLGRPPYIFEGEFI